MKKPAYKLHKENRENNPVKRKTPKFQATKSEHENFSEWWKNQDFPAMTFEAQAEMIFVSGLRLGLDVGYEAGFEAGQEYGPTRIG